MDRRQPTEQTLKSTRRNKGQTLAEFALTLPLLLLLVFGTVEFGRLFQAWVTLQNAAREATRYATTGQYDRALYNLDFETPVGTPPEQIGAGTLNQVVPCVAGDQRGTSEVVSPAGTADATYTIQTWRGVEGLYATWFNGEDCDPTNDDHLERRKDIARMLSIMDVAYNSADGASLNVEALPGGTVQEAAWQRLTRVWGVPRRAAGEPIPMAGDNEPGWFNVMICSTRFNIFERSTAYDGTPAGDRGETPRFRTILDEDDLNAFRDATNGQTVRSRFEAPFCLNNEVMGTPPPGQTNPNVTQAGARWLDPGAPGDRVVVALQFNHPLITPLGLAPWVRMEVRRSGVNEAFRASRALAAVQGSAPIGGGIDTPTPRPPTNTPLPTNTATATPTESPTPTVSPTPTPSPFTCSALAVNNPSFVGQRFYMQMANNSVATAVLTRARLQWRENPNPPENDPDMFLAASALNSETHWTGELTTSPFDTDLLVGPDRDVFLGSDRLVRGLGNVSVYEGLFLNATNNLANVMTIWDFAGSQFDFRELLRTNPDGTMVLGDTVCTVQLQLPTEPPPTEEPTPGGNATATFTPNCASNSLRVEWVGFETFGVVRLRVVNDRYQPAPFTDFSIVWPVPANLPANSVGLQKVVVEGDNANSPNAITIWQANGTPPNNADYTSPTTRGEGQWLRDYSFPAGPNSVTNLFLDFTHSGTLNSAPFNFQGFQFNGTQFTIGCGSRGGGGGGGGQPPAGPIFLATNAPPGPTNTPRPSNTPGPSPTPTATRPSNTPRPTNTPGPTPTPRPTNTPTFTPSPTVRSLPTLPGSGGGEP
ncbi:MAG: TadE family protein [bacterium]|nr:TadE family protein [bacterium]